MDSSHRVHRLGRSETSEASSQRVTGVVGIYIAPVFNNHSFALHLEARDLLCRHGIH
jgi:hypothetical protein